jgi:hypothetical protein
MLNPKHTANMIITNSQKETSNHTGLVCNTPLYYAKSIEHEWVIKGINTYSVNSS